MHVSDFLEHTDNDYAAQWLDETITDFDLLNRHLNKLCKDRKIVLMIDEVDQTSNNRVFVHFLGMLRAKYLTRDRTGSYTFQSVILAGVYDIRNIKLKLINEGVYAKQVEEGKLYNSPWNIAVNFTVDMSFAPDEISSMLIAYEADHESGMDIARISEEIYKYTSGYPFLVSRICQCIDEEFEQDWTIKGVQEAVKVILSEKSVLFDDVSKNLENNNEVYDFLYSLLIVGESKDYISDNPVIELCSMYGYIKSRNGADWPGKTGPVVITNKIFEMRMSYYFCSKDKNVSRLDSACSRKLSQEVARGGVFDMELCLRKFAEHYREIFTEKDMPFLERHGRLLFLSYLKPLVNGQGFYHIESEFTDLRRMDVVVDFGADQFIIEMKLWKGEAAQEKAYEQLLGYMDKKNMEKGYLLTFDFRKEKAREFSSEWTRINGKDIFEVIV